MADQIAQKDPNRVSSLVGVDSIAFTDTTTVAVNATTHAMLVEGGGGGTQYANGDAVATPTGTVALGFDGANVRALTTDSSGNLQVDVLSGGGGGTQYCLNGAVKSSLAICLADAGSSTSVTTVQGLLNKIDEISGYIRTGLFGIAGIFLIIAGYYFVTGGGEPEKLTKARQMLINALIGVAIAVAATGLVGIVKDLVK